jgi:rubrerythrin
MRLLISEVHNFGGFFGGDTVSLSGAEWRAAEAAERTLTIDEAALANVPDRHQVAAGMLLELQFAGERVERATLLGAGSHAALRAALGPPALPNTLAAPLLLAHRCASCALWVPTTQDPARCPICATPADALT